MTPLIPAWTRRHTALAVAAALVAGCAAVATTEPWPAALIVALAAALAFAGALAFDPFVGAVIGLAAAAGSIAVKRQLGLWTGDAFTASVVETGALLLIGIVAGIAGASLRVAQRAPGAPGPTGDAAVGSLGLLDLDLGMLRLEEEVERAALHKRPLAVLRLSLDVHGHEGWGSAQRLAVERAVARLLENLLRPTDVPFVLDADELAAVLPETTSDEAWGIVVPILDAITRASFVAGPAGGRHQVGEYADIRFGLAFFGEHGTTAQELLDAATSAVRIPDADRTGLSAPPAHEPRPE